MTIPVNVKTTEYNKTILPDSPVKDDPYKHLRDAFNAGKTLEVKFPGQLKWDEWRCSTPPKFDGDLYCYRVKPEAVVPHKRAPHRHADVIKAWADGAEIQYKNEGMLEWCTCDKTPFWNPLCNYRIKPEPKPDRYQYAAITDESVKWYFSPILGANTKFTFDGETGKLKNVEML